MSDFENPYFTICISPEEYKKVVSTQKVIVIRCQYNCYCYDESPRPTDFFIIKSRRKDGIITEKMIIQKLIKSKYDPGCNHQFYEGAHPTSLDGIFDIHFAS